MNQSTVSANRKTSILIADENTLIRESWSFYLNAFPRFRVVGDCGNKHDLVQRVVTLCPEIVLMDANMPGVSYHTIVQLREQAPASKIIVISMHRAVVFVQQVFQKGASGYLSKTSSLSELFTAVSEVVSGKSYISQEIKNAIAEENLFHDGYQAKPKRITEREMDIMELIREGLSASEISEKLNITVSTVEVHRHKILNKLGLKDPASLVNHIYNGQLACNN